VISITVNIQRLSHAIGVAAVVTLAACGMDSSLEIDNTSTMNETRGLVVSNGLALSNGLAVSNGLQLRNGVSLKKGLVETTGISIGSGLSSESGVGADSLLLTSSAGRELLKYLVECALPAGDTISKQGTTYFGAVGLAPEWKDSACDEECQEWVSACLLARTNLYGTKVEIEMRAEHPAIGLGRDDGLFVQEGAFFGNLFQNPPQAYVCSGSGALFSHLKKRSCTSGTCGIKGTNYGLCSAGCQKTGFDWLSGPVENCKSSLFTFRPKVYSGVITTYFRPL
jgi:hypothetical protein